MSNDRTFFGTRKPDAVGDGLPPDAPRGKDAERILAAEQLAAFRHWAQSTTEAIARLGGRIVNDVLSVRSEIFPVGGDGTLEISFHVPAGCIVLDNYSAHDVIVSSSGRNASVPVPGHGVYRVKAGTYRPVNVASRVITLYGTAGDEISFQVFATGGIIAGSGLGAVNGGGA